MRTRNGLSILAFILIAVAPAAVNISAQTANPKSLAQIQDISQGLELLVQQVAPCVVQVFAMGYSVSSNAMGPTIGHQSTGSGIILDPEGYIVTNSHVVYGSRRIQVQLAGRAEADPAGHTDLRPRGAKIDAQLVGMDLVTDLAVLRINQKDLPVLNLADSNNLKQGQLVLAFGSPLGLTNTVTMGVVSAIDRQLRPDDPRVYVQTDAPINPGNSGGPLVDTHGQVVGINTMILSQSGGSEGVGLAIPSNMVKTIYQQLRANGVVHRGMIGVTPQAITPALATALGLQQSWGVILADVTPDGPADNAGLKIGDVILSVDGTAIRDVPDFSSHVHHHPINTTLALDVMRDWQQLTLRVQVTQHPEDPGRFLNRVDPQKNRVPQLGILGIEIDGEIANLLAPLRKDKGVLVVAISSEDTTPDDRLLPGDIIHGLNKMPITTLAELKALCEKLKESDAVVVQVERQGKMIYIIFDESPSL